MAKPMKLAHVVYQTRRYEEMLAWYQQVFEAEVRHQDPAFAFVSFDEEHHRMAFANLDVIKPVAGPAASGEIGVNHVAYTFASAADLLHTYERLKAAGILPYWPIHHGVTLSLYYRDPDGNRMEFQVDALSPEAANAYMTSPAFAANAAGVGYDPDALLARWKAGASEAELLKAPTSGPLDIPVEHGLS